MKKHDPAPLHTWLIDPLDQDVSAAIDRLRMAPDIQHVAVMPDVHLASDVCVGTVFGTSRLIYPQAVGGDIGCGMLAVATNGLADALSNPKIAGEILCGIGKAVPAMRRHRQATIEQPKDLRQSTLSHPQLESIRRADGILQFGTLGGGNHFIELQADDDDRLWLMIHSGSRAMGQAIRSHHLSKAEPVGFKLKALDAGEETGRAYLNDVAWARQYAAANRLAMAECVSNVLKSCASIELEWNTLIAIDHNHVALEHHGGEQWWVHRKGAMPASSGMIGVVPGSMGTVSFHVEGKGYATSLNSSAHGAGRELSRHASRNSISQRDVHRQMDGIWYDYRLVESLREEAPAAYKDIRAVLRAQRDLVKVVRVVRPVLNYKGR